MYGRVIIILYYYYYYIIILRTVCINAKMNTHSTRNDKFSQKRGVNLLFYMCMQKGRRRAFSDAACRAVLVIIRDTFLENKLKSDDYYCTTTHFNMPLKC